ncbi:PAS domain-containing protein [uncultured Ferrovibrio sp.]|jgi:PAS domain S-box|uniref:PAS domain-containing protein n=1 Tax=uncultured Ferrovibrio sp. TaxID=1576913 RepID=UPI002638DCCC|nr:PAS domain-containing protein [uncultured Ferrovibrio sp.]
MKRPVPTNRERSFSEDDIIVSKTDLQGRITYANDVFCKIGLYGEAELIGQPHSILRHPDMPRCVFKMMWDHIKSGNEIFAYVKNLAKNGDHYWVLAHVTPSYDDNGKISGYHSNRRAPDRAALAAIEPIYRDLLTEESRHADRNAGMRAGAERLNSILAQRGQDYHEFIFSLPC